MTTINEVKSYTLTQEELDTLADTLVKKALDHWWPADEMGSWLKYISDQDITEWLGDDVAGMMPDKGVKDAKYHL